MFKMFYVIFTSCEDENVQSRVGIVVAETSERAHIFAEDEFRKENNIPMDKWVKTDQLFHSDDPNQADIFFNAFMDESRRLEEASNLN